MWQWKFSNCNNTTKHVDELEEQTRVVFNDVSCLVCCRESGNDLVRLATKGLLQLFVLKL